MTQPVFNTNPDCLKLIAEGKCKADCCGNVEMPRSYFRLLKKFIPEGKLYEPYYFAEEGSNTPMVKPLTPDFRCVFLNDTGSCNIFDSNMRPEICRQFGCNTSEPLLACKHINEDIADLIEEFAFTKLQVLAQEGNPLAQKMLEEMQAASNAQQEEPPAES